MSEKRDDARATAEDLIADADRLKEIERAKLDPGLRDEEADRLSDEGEEVTRAMLAKARVQQKLNDPAD